LTWFYKIVFLKFKINTGLCILDGKFVTEKFIILKLNLGILFLPFVLIVTYLWFHYKTKARRKDALLSCRKDYERAVSEYERQFTDANIGSHALKDWINNYSYLNVYNKIPYRRLGLDKQYVVILDKYYTYTKNKG
jgi:hypothetical protein